MLTQLSKKYLSCFLVSLFSFYSLFLLASFNVIALPLLKEFHLTPTILGVLSSFGLWGNILGFIPIGFLLDRYSVKKLTLYFLLLAIIATAGIAITTNLYFIGLMRFLQGLASAASLLVLMRVGALLRQKNSNTMIGLMIMIALSGGICGNYIFSTIVNMLGWRDALLIATLIGGCCFIVILIFFSEQTSNVIRGTKYVSTQFIQSCKKHNIIAGICIGLINSPVFILGVLWGNYYLMHRFSLSITQAASVSSLLFVGIIIGSPFWGWLADKWFDAWKILYCTNIALATLILSLLLVKTISYLTLSCIFLGLGFFCCSQNLIYPYISKNNPLLTVSTAMGVAALISNAVGALLQICFGLLMQEIPTEYYLSMSLFLSLFLISFLLNLFYFKPIFVDNTIDKTS